MVTKIQPSSVVISKEPFFCLRFAESDTVIFFDENRSTKSKPETYEQKTERTEGELMNRTKCIMLTQRLRTI